MTENKKYTYHFNGAIRINNKELVAYANNEINAQYLCKLLNKQEEKIQKLESENKILKTTIGRNESYIKRLTTLSKWSNTGDMND